MRLTRAFVSVGVIAGSLFASNMTGSAAESFTRHVVVAQEGNAAEAGRDILRRGR